MPALPSFINYKPGRKTKVGIKSPFSLLRGEQQRAPSPPIPGPSNLSTTQFAASEVIDINDQGGRYSDLDFDGGKPIDESEKNLVDEEPVLPRPVNSPLPQVQLDIDLSPEALTDWFAANFLRSSVLSEAEPGKASGSGLRNEIYNASSNGGGLSVKQEGRSGGGDDDDSYASSSEDVIANLEAMNPSHFGKLPGYENFNRLEQSSPRKQAPNPITIPAGQSQSPQATRSSNGISSYKSPRPASSMDTPLSSAVSGTTLARALMSNTFVLSNDNRASRYRSGLVGLTRSDSMTLPRDSFQGSYNNDRFSVGPDAPAMPSNAELLYEPPKKTRSPTESRERKKQALSRRSSTGSLSTKALQDSMSVTSGRPNSALFSPGIEFDINSIMSKSPESEKPPSLPRSPLPPTPKLPYSAGADSNFTQSSGSGSAQEVTQRTPPEPHLLSPYTNLSSPSASFESHQSARNLDDVLNYYSLPDSPAPLLAGANYRPAVSPISEESTSQLSPPSIFRSDKRESQRSTPVGARSPLSWRGRGDSLPLPRTPPEAARRSPKQPSLSPVGERPRSTTQLPSPSSSQSASSFASAGSDLLAPPPVSSIFNRQRSGSAPSPIKVVRDSRDANAYQITVTPQISDAGTPTTDDEAVVTQEFPETPDAFSPLLTTGTDESPGMLQTLGGHEVAPMPNVPMSATFPNRNSSQPSLAQQLLLNRAGTTVRHAPQASVSKIRTNGLGGRSASPASRRIADISQHSSEGSSSSLAKPEVTVEGPSNDLHGQTITEELSNSPEETSAPPLPSPSNLISADHLSRSPSRGTSITQNSDASSMYASSSPSSKPRNKSLPPIPTTPSPVASMMASSPLGASSSLVSISSPDQPAGPAAVTNLAPVIPPPPSLPPPSPTPSQKARAPSARGRLPPALNINHSNISAAERAVAVNGTDTNSENSPASSSHQEVEVPVAITNPAAAPNGHDHTNSFSYKDDQFTGRASDIFRGTSVLGSPPPYYSVVGEGTKPADNTPATNLSQAQSTNTSSNYVPQTSALAGPSTSTGEWTSSPEHRTPLARGDSTLSRSRMRPPLPAGPRRPSQMMTNFPPQRDRAGSVTSISSSAHASNPLVQAVRTRSEAPPINSPKFQTPPPKWRGYTMEAAKWTFTSAQLQAIVSRAIRQSAEASSIRLLRLDVLDNEIPEEIRRLEAQRTDLKTRYKVLTRRRTATLESLASHVSGADEESPTHGLRLVEELKELAIALDKIAEELHSVDAQLDHLSSLTHIHTGSALAMALRKLNASFLKQMTENQVLRNQIQALEAERDEAWQQAEFVANEYDRHLNDSLSSKRSSRVSAKRKSSVRVSKAGLRTPSQRLSQISSLGLTPSSAKSPLLRLDRVPPVPPIPKRRPHELSAESPLKSSAALSPSGMTPTSETRAMLQAQDELYAMLGLSNPERPLRRSLSFSMLQEQSPGIPGQPLLSPRRLSSSGRGTSWRRSSLPGDNALAETYNAMAADRNAILATIDMLSSTD